MDTALKDFTELLEMVPGTELGSSDWYTVTQDDINTFATLTKDEDPYHVDPDWAKLNSPLSTTISFGFLTLSMLTYWGLSDPKYLNSSVVSTARKALVRQMREMLGAVYRTSHHVCENYSPWKQE